MYLANIFILLTCCPGLYTADMFRLSCISKETLAKIHHGHQGIQRCQARVMTSVWWPGVSQAVETYVKHCSHCQKKYVPPKEPRPYYPQHCQVVLGTG